MEIKNRYFTFSEAIRDGAKLAPAGRYRVVSGARTCAIGAGIHAIQGELPYRRAVDESYVRELVALYPYLNSAATCPFKAACGWQGFRCDDSRLGTLAHLVDDHGWTREQAADWLEGEEEKLGYVRLAEKESDAGKIDERSVSEADRRVVEGIGA